MVDIKHVPLKVLLGFALLSAGCAMNPFQSSPRAPVEQPQPVPAPQPTQGKHIERTPAQEPPPAVATPMPEPPASKDEMQALPVEKPVTEKSVPAVIALLDDSDRQAAAGKQQQAIASIERALRIDPKNPLLWNRLARLRLQDGQWPQAIAMAKKSNVLAVKDRKLQSDNWGIIARAREATGDKDGARQALDMAQQLLN